MKISNFFKKKNNTINLALILPVIFCILLFVGIGYSSTSWNIFKNTKNEPTIQSNEDIKSKDNIITPNASTDSSQNTVTSPATDENTSTTQLPKYTSRPSCYYVEGGNVCLSKDEYDSIIYLKTIKPLPNYCDKTQGINGMSPDNTKNVRTDIENSWNLGILSDISRDYLVGSTQWQVMLDAENARHNLVIQEIGTQYAANIKSIVDTYNCVWY